MEFENLSTITHLPKTESGGPLRSNRANLVLAKLSGLDEKFNDFSQELILLEKSGIKIDSLIAKLEEIIKVVDESKSKLKSGGRNNAKKGS